MFFATCLKPLTKGGAAAASLVKDDVVFKKNLRIALKTLASFER